jgi:hypothetical protein
MKMGRELYSKAKLSFEEGKYLIKEGYSIRARC